MKATLRTRFFTVIIGLVALAVLGNVMAAFFSWRLSQLFQKAADENLPAVRAAEELEIALLEQRGLVSSYILDDGNPKWLEDIPRRKENFGHWLEQARAAALTPGEQEILLRLEDVFREYDAEREQVRELYDAGRREEATEALLRPVNDLYKKAYDLCEQLIAINQREVDDRTASARRYVGWMTGSVVVLVALTVVMGALLLWLFFAGVLRPLRRMAVTARELTDGAEELGEASADDELKTVGLYLQALVSDVAETRSALADSRSRLADAEKLATVGKLAASVAHEIRNPLTAVKMWLYSLQTSLGGEAAVDHKFQVISEELRRLECIVRDFLEFARPPRLTIEPQSIGSLVENTLELFRPRLEAKAMTVVWQPEAGLPPVLADPHQFRQVMLNLLSNAVEASSEGSQLRITAALEPGSHGRPMVVLRVQDAGSGVPEEFRSRIFEPFFSTKEEGIGLGLCIAARIMARHSGHMVLESTGPSGTTVAVWMPVAAQEARG